MKNETLECKSTKVLERIIKKRQELGVSQMELAFKLHLSSNGYFKIEKGKTKLSVLRLLQIAEVLKVKPCCFFEDYR
jgi:transcriptional regulator with XRE-family HTH domain